MNSLFQRNWYTSVRRSGDDLLQAETCYVDSERETAARLTVNVQDFRVREAIWEEHRTAGKSGTSVRTVPVLHGQEAYFNAGAALRQVAQYLADPLAVPLFAETVKGLIQGETFLWDRRGYNSAEEYSRYWAEYYAGSCRYYSNLDRVETGWFQHVGEEQREGNLFVRFKTQTLYSLNEGTYLLTGNLSDSFHQVSVNLELNADDFRVVRAAGTLHRTPDKVCREASGFLQDMVGLGVKGLDKKVIAGLLGKGQGCVHLIDLVNDAVQILDLYKF